MKKNKYFLKKKLLFSLSALYLLSNSMKLNDHADAKDLISNEPKEAIETTVPEIIPDTLYAGVSKSFRGSMDQAYRNSTCDSLCAGVLKEMNTYSRETNPNSEMFDEAVYQSYLIEYSNYFHLDSQKIIEIAKNTTNNFQNFENIIGTSYDLSNKEAACMIFVYLFNKNGLTKSWEELGYTKEDLLTTTENETYRYDHIDDLVLSNGMDYTHYLGKICDLFGVKEKSIALAITYSEMDKDDPDDITRTLNNFGGMRYENKFLALPTPEAGIICMCGNFRNRFNDYTINDVQSLAGHYVAGQKDTSNEETKTWASNVEPFYYQICENYDYYFYPQEKEFSRSRILN